MKAWDKIIKTVVICFGWNKERIFFVFNREDLERGKEKERKEDLVDEMRLKVIFDGIISRNFIIYD